MPAAKPQAPPVESEELSDHDRDSLHTLPISILPVQTQIFSRPTVLISK